MVQQSKKYQFVSTHPTVKHDSAVPRNANVDIAPKFLKKCFWNGMIQTKHSHN